jgi:hypothetical protein
MNRLAGFVALCLLVLGWAGAAVAAPAQPLFDGEGILDVVIRGPIQQIRRTAPLREDIHAAVLELRGERQETHEIGLAARGITRRQRDVCTFPPLRIEFREPPGRNSLFAGQRRLKLVTHCRPPESFQDYILLEYAAYRLFNRISPHSVRVRLASITYVAEEGREPSVSRLGFFIEDVGRAARRNGMASVGAVRISPAQLSAAHAARLAVFQYMIGNLDWSLIAGPPGAGCCHNVRLVGADRRTASGLIPIPYDFDHSGLVDAPYATPPPQIAVQSVRTRRYRRQISHNQAAPAAAGPAR